MGKSYRIRTELGINKTITFDFEQDFEYLEILSLKIQQEDVYTRDCAQYGVITGRVTANNGLGVPNARVSVFVPIEPQDKDNPIINQIYPYTNPKDKNEDGYRYNLLPHEKSYSTHAATGTFPSRTDALNDATAFEIYEKYYKYTVKTNDSGDYMIFGVPVGTHTMVMDVDLSDIGEFSLTPQDLIRMGLATDAQVAGNRFKTSTDLNSLPQIISITKSLEVSPLWGEATICQIAINRVDFDLRDDANVDIQPTSVFMGSIYSTGDKFRVRSSCRPKDDMGNLCGLVAGPGQILSIRHTINQDSSGQPILEQYELEQSGNVIDGAGAWLTEVPMNLDYYYTNEFGEKTLSADPKIGIPTKARYRFKIKWTQPKSLSEQTRRAYWLVPNVKEYGWDAQGNSDPTNSGNINQVKQLGSYYFGLDWSGYTNPSEAISCEDTFYEFEFNRVYTVSGLIDEWKKGNKGRFIGIKEIDNDDCANNVNKFPVNDAFRNFDLLFFLFSILFSILQPIGLIIIVIAHVVIYLWNNFAKPLTVALIALFLASGTNQALLAGAAATGSVLTIFGTTLSFPPLPFVGLVPVPGSALMAIWHGVLSALYYTFAFLLIRDFDKITQKLENVKMKIPMITYPDCQMCECVADSLISLTSDGGDSVAVGNFLTPVSDPGRYIDYLTTEFEDRGYFGDENSQQILALMVSDAMAGRAIGSKTSQYWSKVPVSKPYKQTAGILIDEGDVCFGPCTDYIQSMNQYLPIGERVNKFNLRDTYFRGENKIKVTFAAGNNTAYHYDNTLTVFTQIAYSPGQLLSFVNPTKSKDLNFLYSATTNGGVINGISGSSLIDTGDIITVTYCDPSNDRNGINVQYRMPYGGNQNQRTHFPADIELYQVLTAITLTYKTIPNVGRQFLNPNFYGNNGFWAYLNNLGGVNGGNLIKNYKGNWLHENCSGIPGNQSELVLEEVGTPYAPGYFVNGNGPYVRGDGVLKLSNHDFFDGFEQQFVTILQRGVDFYSPKFDNKYGIGKILGYPNEDDVIITASTKLNIPIQPIVSSNNTAVQNHFNSNEILLPSYFFTPGIIGSTRPDEQYKPFSTNSIYYYSSFDRNRSGSPYSIILPANTSESYVTTNQFNNQFANPTTFYTDYQFVSTGTRVPFYQQEGIFENQKYYSTANKLDGGAIMGYTTYSLAIDGCPFGNHSYTYHLYVSSPNVAGDTNEPADGNWSPNYYSWTYFGGSTPPTPINVNRGQTVMRTDRLPSSDYSDRYVKKSRRNPLKPGEDFSGNVSLLQQNTGFATYLITDDGGSSALSPSFGNGADMVTPDISDLPGGLNAISTLGDCENMVSLSCYEGNGVNFKVKDNCESQDNIENGCYVFFNNPDDLFGDIERDSKSWAEWGYRFRFFYGLCRGVLAQSFVNNWVNGSLYSFPFQVDTKYDANNKPYSEYCDKLLYFDYKTNNFYYRSSPYSTSTKKFVGAPAEPDGTNKKQLLFPTTIINLGMKASFYKEISFNPTTNSFVIDKINSTSYADTSDLVNLFVISRICDESFLQQVFGSTSNNNNLNQLFSRDHKRVDGDLAQSMSINCEIGNVPFSPEFYKALGVLGDPVVLLGFPGNNPTMGVFYSSTTEDLQIKDYLTPGLINFRQSINSPSVATFSYGIKTQNVPFYQWKLSTTSNIFGDEKDNWATNKTDIFSRGYQSLDRRTLFPFQPNSSSYFIGSNTSGNDIRARGYIYNEDNSGNYSINSGIYPSKFLVGAPFHFYFGIIKGESALDKFKAKYLADE